MEIDFQTLLLDPLYAEFGVTAVFTPNGNDGEIVFTVIDMTVGIAVAADAIVIDSTQPAATVRYAEVVDQGLNPDQDLSNGLITFNDNTWQVKSWRPKPSGGGHAKGEIILFLMTPPV